MMQQAKQPKIIVIGNEKGGSGKTTTSMHLICYLLHLGFKIASFDIDTRQLSLTRYLENRQKNPENLLMPKHYKIEAIRSEDPNTREKREEELFLQQLEEAKSFADFIIIDTPGSYSALSRLVHSFADIVITPMNDSFLDMDLLAKIDSDMNVISPSIYSAMLWEQKMARLKRDGGQIKWIVMRNRLSFTDAINKRNVGEVLEKLQKRISFILAEGFSERVIFRELFLQGLTLLDLKNFNLTMSHIAARQELRKFIKILAIKEIEEACERKDKVVELV